tara:strand:- start:4466 stop:4798 length:333 start_codon:yes stop_codon:yes gene_type:complete
VKITEKRLKQIIKEEMELQDQYFDYPDQEGSMAKRQLEDLAQYASELAMMMDDNTQLEGWVQSKITLAQDYISKVKHYLEDELGMSTGGCGSEGEVFVVGDDEMHSLMEE